MSTFLDCPRTRPHLEPPTLPRSYTQTNTIAYSSSLLTTLSHLIHSSTSLTIALPPEILEYVERGRNPDIYNREFVEAIQRANQQSKGRSEAFAAFRDVLAGEIAGTLPVLTGDVERAVRGGEVRLEGIAPRTGGA
jgi:mediator of RNA polymerase II transcription subunit 10